MSCTEQHYSAMYSMNSFTTSAIPLNCESGRDLPKRVTLGEDIFPMSNLGSASVEGDPLLPFLFKLRFSSALGDEIGVFKPVSLLFMVRRALEGLCDMTLVHTAFPLFFFWEGGLLVIISSFHPWVNAHLKACVT